MVRSPAQGEAVLSHSAAFRLKQVLAFAAVYVIWGSTFLAIRIAIETLPGFTMAAVRFLAVATLLLVWARLRGESAPSLRQWGAAALVGGLLFAGGNGAVVWAEQHVASGLVALLVATEPLWVVIVLALTSRTERPRPLAVVGMLFGFSGAALLAAPGVEGTIQHLPSVIVVVLGSLAWACGSLAARSGNLPRSILLSSGMQMLAGGLILTVMGALAGEWGQVSLAEVSARSLAALAYLIFVGALIGFLAYNFLVRTTAPTLVATYAFVNPMVAVFLGWWLADEQVSSATLVAALLIIVSVVLVTWGSVDRSRPKVVEEEPVRSAA
ncbi:MAG TPA: EamA family transporter [Thermoanaerobaculia bacterium]|nr:EamA family transporter [Thermoanaerobaculia bacterium]